MAAVQILFACLALQVLFIAISGSITIGGGKCTDTNHETLEGEPTCHGQNCQEKYGEGKCRCDDRHYGEYCTEIIDYGKIFGVATEEEKRLEGEPASGTKQEGKIELQGEQNLFGVTPEILASFEHPFLISAIDESGKTKYIYVKSGSKILGGSKDEVLTRDDKDDKRNIFVLRRRPDLKNSRNEKDKDKYLLFNFDAGVYVYVPKGDEAVALSAKYVPMDGDYDERYGDMTFKIESANKPKYRIKDFKEKRLVLVNGAVKARYEEPFNAQSFEFTAISTKTELRFSNMGSPINRQYKSVVDKCFSFPKDPKEAKKTIEYEKKFGYSIFTKFRIDGFSLQQSLGVQDLSKANIDDKNWLNVLRTRSLSEDKDIKGTAKYEVKTSKTDNTCVVVVLKLLSSTLKFTATAYTKLNDWLVKTEGLPEVGKLGPEIPGSSNGFIDYYDVYNTVTFKVLTTKDECPKCGN